MRMIRPKKFKYNLMPPTPERIVRLFVRRALLLLTLIIIVAFPCFSQRQTKDDKYWALSEKYCNARFGFCVGYPASLLMDPAPANDDGRRFDNGNGLYVTASGINNSSHDTLKSEMRTDSDRFDH